jgi:hypothetical protein
MTLRTARITVTTALDVCDGGGGVGASLVGTFPANAVPERAHVRARAITNRLMVFSFRFENVRPLALKTE